MSSNKHKVSIILPIYNVEKYLNQSLDSLINQTLEDLEIICIDDGSVDNSLRILREYEKKDARIKVIESQHKNAANARNIGLNIATGEYIGFVDPDDWAGNNMYEKMYIKAKETKSDIVIAQAYSYHENRLFFKLTKGTYKIKGMDKKCYKNTFNAYDIKDKIFNLPVSCLIKFYSREFLINNKIYFPDIDTSEDQRFFVHSVLLAKRIILYDEFLYYYRKKRIGSHSHKRNLHALDTIRVFYSIEELLENLSLIEDFKVPFLKKYARSSIKWYKKAHPSIKEEYLKQLIPQLKHIENKYSDEILKKFIWYREFKKLVAS